MVPQRTDLREEILREFHYSHFFCASWWHEDVPRSSSPVLLKRHVGDFIRQCLTCQQVKAEHQKAIGLLRPLEAAEWKWEHIAMDFVSHLPQTQWWHDVVWVIVDRLTKSAHFLEVQMTSTMEEFCRLCIQKIV